MVLPVEDGKTPTKKVKVKTSHFLCHHLSLFDWEFCQPLGRASKKPTLHIAALSPNKKIYF